MAGCTKCSCELDAAYVDLGLAGTFCRPCFSLLSEEGNQQIEEDRRLYGNQVVEQRIREIQNIVDRPATRH